MGSGKNDEEERERESAPAARNKATQAKDRPGHTSLQITSRKPSDSRPSLELIKRPRIHTRTPVFVNYSSM